MILVLDQNDFSLVIGKLMIVSSAGMFLELFFFGHPFLQPLHASVLTSFSNISLAFLA